MDDPGGAGGCGAGAVAATLIEQLDGWCDAAEVGLSQCFDRDRDAIVDGVEHGHLKLWRFDGGRAWMVTREESSDLVVCCFQGTGLAQYAAIIYAAARASGFLGVRFFSARAGLARLLKAYGFLPELTVYRCTVN
jgi:hypothetical protein